MKKACLLGKIDEREKESLERELLARGCILTSSIRDAEIALYTEGLDEALASLEGASVRVLVPLFSWRDGGEGVPPPEKDEKSLGRIDFETEGVTEVSKKVSALIDKIPESERRFSDIKRFLLGNGIELAQNALIHRKLSGAGGSAHMELFEGREAYRLQVTDSFGALRPGDIIKSIVRAARERACETKESGAGLGLYMTLRSSDSMIFRLDPGRSARICCIIKKYKRLKEFKSKSPALFIVTATGVA